MSAHGDLWLALYLAIGLIATRIYWAWRNPALAPSVQLVSALIMGLGWPLVAVSTLWLMMIAAADRRSGRGGQ